MSFISQLNALCSRLKPLAQLLSRLIIGYVFVTSGWVKLQNLEKVIGFFKSLGIPVAELHAPFVACTEILCGALVLVGLFTQIASVPLLIIMAMAVATAKRADIHDLKALFTTYEFVYIAVLLWLMSEGSGPISLSRILNRKSKKSKKR